MNALDALLKTKLLNQIGNWIRPGTENPFYDLITLDDLVALARMEKIDNAR